MQTITKLLFITLLLFTTNYTIAQTSCSYIVHVTTTGSNVAGCGTEGNPCLTINYGIGEAVSQGLSDVRVSNGTYNEVVELQTGVNIWGGYDASWTQVGMTTLNGAYSPSLAQYVAVVANGVTGGAIVSHFDINAPDAFNGKSSYGIHMISSDVVVQECIVNGGAGANGNNGNNGAAGTGNALGGANGANGTNITTSSCSTTLTNFGNGATGPAGTGGGNGGYGGSPDTDCGGFPFSFNGAPQPGQLGANAATYNFLTWGYRGDAGAACADGSNGNDGITIHGNGGNGAATANSLVSNFWVTTTAANGSLGLNGTGGGGGGGGGGCGLSGENNSGGGGGGGGAGGLRSTLAGTGGTSGGNSAAIFVASSNIEVINTVIYIGTGGNGGNGGASGIGATGGLGGNGGTGGGTTGGDGGDGGNGANGADSGAGGGGAGGSAYGMYLTNSLSLTNNLTFNSGTAGSAGLAGTSINAQGTNGSNGALVNVDGVNFTNNSTTNGTTSGICVEIITQELANNEYCAGDAISVDYNAVGDFTGANIFTAEMSDALGSFASPTVIGSVTSMTSGFIPSTIPVSTLAGAGYKFRVVSSAPVATGSETTTAVTINGLPPVSYAVSGGTVICLGNAITLTGTGADTYTWDNGVTNAQSFNPGSTMDYIVTGTNTTTGCSNMDTVTITVNLPSTNTIVESSCGDYLSAQGNTYTTTGMYDEIYVNAVGCDSTVTIDLTVNTIDLTVDVANSIYTALGTGTYQWVDCADGYQAIAGETGQAFAPTANGDYAVIITDGPCVDTSACTAIFNVGLDEISFTNSINAYPNPTTGKITIEMNDVQEGVLVELVNIAGQTILSENYYSTSKIDLNLDAPNGVYFVYVTSADKSAVIKVVKEN